MRLRPVKGGKYMKLIKKYLFNNTLKDIFSNMTKGMVAIYFIIAISFYGIHESFVKMNNNVARNLDCVEAIDNMSNASDDLTTYSRRFVVVGDKNALQAYYDEVVVLNQRYKSIKTLEKYSEVDISPIYTAWQNSIDLSYREIYAMKLAATARKMNVDSRLDRMHPIDLSSGDLSLSDDEMLRKAIGMIYGTAYEEQKAVITTHISETMAIFKQEVERERNTSFSTYYTFIHFLYIGMSILLLTNLVALWVPKYLLAKPIEKFVACINQNKPCDIKGIMELQILIDAYNKQFYRNKQRQANLSYKANYDGLTGVLNRRVFARLLADVTENGNGALLLIDVDKFKGINDTYGHAAGDLLLKRIATLLKMYFIDSNMYVTRFGGDEFAIVINELHGDTTALRKRIYKIGTALNNVLKNNIFDEKIPHSSLSIGAAFTEDVPEEQGKTLFECTDATLYEVKAAGRGNIRIYQP